MVTGPSVLCVGISPPGAMAMERKSTVPYREDAQRMGAISGPVVPADGNGPDAKRDRRDMQVWDDHRHAGSASSRRAGREELALIRGLSAMPQGRSGNRTPLAQRESGRCSGGWRTPAELPANCRGLASNFVLHSVEQK